MQATSIRHEAGAPELPAAQPKESDPLQLSSPTPPHPHFLNPSPSVTAKRNQDFRSLQLRADWSRAAPMKRRGQPPAPKAKGKAKKAAEEAEMGHPNLQCSVGRSLHRWFGTSH